MVQIAQQKEKGHAEEHRAHQKLVADKGVAVQHEEGDETQRNQQEHKGDEGVHFPGKKEKPGQQIATSMLSDVAPTAAAVLV
jgi:hypothetical protein